MRRAGSVGTWDQVGFELTWFLVLAVALVASRAVSAQPNRPADSLRSVAFDRIDRSARMALSTIWCARKTAQARADGLFGPIDSLGRRGQCMRIADRSYGVFFTPDTTFTKADRVSVVDLTNSVRYTQPIDTSALLAEARAMNAALRKGFPSYRTAQRQFTPISFRFDGDSIQVWLIAAGSVI